MQIASGKRRGLVWAFLALVVGALALATGWALERQNARRRERAELKSGMELLCASSIAKAVQLAVSARAVKALLDKAGPESGVQGSFEVLSPEKDREVLALFGERDPQKPFGSDPDDGKRVTEIWEKVGKTDGEAARRCNAIVEATERCFPSFSWTRELTALDRACIQKAVEAPLAELNAYVSRNIRFDKSLATPRENSSGQ